MHMRMVLEVLAPSVQDSGDADVGAKVLGIAGNGGERLGCGGEQQSVELGLVLVGDGSERRRQREHHMEVGHWQEFSLARRHPCLSGRPLALRAVAVCDRSYRQLQHIPYVRGPRRISKYRRLHIFRRKPVTDRKAE